MKQSNVRTTSQDTTTGTDGQSTALGLDAKSAFLSVRGAQAHLEAVAWCLPWATSYHGLLRKLRRQELEGMSGTRAESHAEGE